MNIHHPHPAELAIQESFQQKLLSAMGEADKGNRYLILRREGDPEFPLPDGFAAEELVLAGDYLETPLAEAKAASYDGIILMDILGRLEDPAAFFGHSERALKPGGRLAMLEPGISVGSWLYYYMSGDRPVDMTADPFTNPSGNHPGRGNLALASRFFNFLEHRITMMERYPDLHLLHQEWLSILAAPLSRGIGSFPLLPESLVHPLLALENTLMPFIGRWIASNLFIVLEKRPNQP